MVLGKRRNLTKKLDYYFCQFREIKGMNEAVVLLLAAIETLAMYRNVFGEHFKTLTSNFFRALKFFGTMDPSLTGRTNSLIKTLNKVFYEQKMSVLDELIEDPLQRYLEEIVSIMSDLKTEQVEIVCSNFKIKKATPAKEVDLSQEIPVYIRRLPEGKYVYYPRLKTFAKVSVNRSNKDLKVNLNATPQRRRQFSRERKFVLNPLSKTPVNPSVIPKDFEPKVDQSFSSTRRLVIYDDINELKKSSSNKSSKRPPAIFQR